MLQPAWPPAAGTRCLLTHVARLQKHAFADFDAQLEQEEQALRSGCTALVLLQWGRNVVVANCGDSRAVLSSTGRAVDISTDHKPATPAELERITKAGRHHGRLGLCLSLHCRERCRSA